MCQSLEEELSDGWRVDVDAAQVLLGPELEGKAAFRFWMELHVVGAIELAGSCQLKAVVHGNHASPAVSMGDLVQVALCVVVTLVQDLVGVLRVYRTNSGSTNLGVDVHHAHVVLAVEMKHADHVVAGEVVVVEAASLVVNCGLHQVFRRHGLGHLE